MTKKSYAVADLSFYSDGGNTIFVKNICLTGIKETCKIINKELKYQFPTKNINIENIENYTFGNVFNDSISNELSQIIEKFDVILTNGNIKKDFLSNYVKGDTKIYDFSKLEEDHQ